jgi:hypothetical protein
VNRLHAEDMLRWIRESRLAALGSDRAEVRALSFVLVCYFIEQLVEVGTYVAFIEESLTHRVASLSAFGTVPLAVAFFGAAAMLVPHWVALAWVPDTLGCRWPRVLAARAGIIGAASWGLLAYLSSPLDYDWLTTVYGTRAFVDLWMAVLFGLSLNAQQAREKSAALVRWQRMQETLQQKGGQ